MTHVTPASSRWLTRSARPTSVVQTELASPYRLSFARRTASSSSSNGTTTKDQSEDLALHDLAVLCGTGDEGGQVVRARSVRHDAARHDPGTGLDGSRDEPVDAVAMGVRDQRADVGVARIGIAHPDR